MKTTTKLLIVILTIFTLTASTYAQIPGCDSRAVAEAIIANQLQKAYSMSVECEKALLKQGSKSFSEPMLGMQYMATAQILTALGKFDEARDRISKVDSLPRNFQIPSDQMENSTKGFLMEKSGSMDEAILFYQASKQSDANARLAIIYLDRKQETAAADAAAAALKDEPTNPTALVVLGILMEKKNPTEALAKYKSALASASAGNPSINPMRYLELPRAIAGIARLKPTH